MGQIKECPICQTGYKKFREMSESAIIVFTAAVLIAVWQSILQQTYCRYSVGLLQVLKTP